MSKNRNKIRAHNRYFTLTGKNKRLIHMPETSSITTREGSLPQTVSTIADDQTPTAVIAAVIIRESRRGGKPPAQAKYQQIQHATAATVPAPLPIYPMPRLVAISLWNCMVGAWLIELNRLIGLIGVIVLMGR